MPNVDQMRSRMSSHLARVSGKALDKEYKRTQGLWLAGKISGVTRLHMDQSAPIRLAWLASAS